MGKSIFKYEMEISDKGKTRKFSILEFPFPQTDSSGSGGSGKLRLPKEFLVKRKYDRDSNYLLRKFTRGEMIDQIKMVYEIWETEKTLKIRANLIYKNVFIKDYSMTTPDDLSNERIYFESKGAPEVSTK